MRKNVENIRLYKMALEFLFSKKHSFFVSFFLKKITWKIRLLNQLLVLNFKWIGFNGTNF